MLNRGSLRAQSPLSATGSQFGILSPTDSNWHWLKPSVSLGYIIVSRPPASCGRTHLPPSPNSITSMSRWYSDIFNQMHLFRCSSAYLLRCISWLTARSRVNMLDLYCILPIGEILDKFILCFFFMTILQPMHDREKYFLLPWLMLQQNVS